VNVLALYDIHGNVAALDAVLADPRAAGADVVVVGGDAVPGPFARATLDRVDALDVPVRWIRGNGEREVAEAVGAPAPADDDMQARTAARRRDADPPVALRALGGRAPRDRRGGRRGRPHAPAGRPPRRPRAVPQRGERRAAVRGGRPDERSIRAALVEPVEPIVVTRIFEDLAG
jgi:hypothetical protein